MGIELGVILGIAGAGVIIAGIRGGFADINEKFFNKRKKLAIEGIKQLDTNYFLTDSSLNLKEKRIKKEIKITSDGKSVIKDIDDSVIKTYEPRSLWIPVENDISGGSKHLVCLDENNYVQAMKQNDILKIKIASQHEDYKKLMGQLQDINIIKEKYEKELKRLRWFKPAGIVQDSAPQQKYGNVSMVNYNPPEETIEG